MNGHENTTVLIVEDEAVIAMGYTRMLQKRKFHILPVAASASAACEADEKDSPDIILMDVFLKGNETGIDAACEIRKKRSVPIIFISGNSDFAMDSALSSYSNSLFLIKPVDIGELVSAIDRLTAPRDTEGGNETQ